MQIQHRHPENLSPDVRAERLRALYRACQSHLQEQGRPRPAKQERPKETR